MVFLLHYHMKSLINTSILVFFSLSFVTNLLAQEESPLVSADQMPYFIGCDDFEDGSDEKRQCSNINLIGFISNNITYPESAKVSGVAGTVYVSFIIDEDGNLVNPEIIRDIGHGCGEVALNVLQTMPKWEPAIHEGEKVKVKLNLPIKFSFKSADNQISDNYSINWGSAKGQKISREEIQKNIGHDPIVRNEVGDVVHMTELQLSINKNGKIKEAASNGSLNKDIKKLLNKAKAGSDIVFKVILQEDGSPVYVVKEFKVIE